MLREFDKIICTQGPLTRSFQGFQQFITWCAINKLHHTWTKSRKPEILLKAPEKTKCEVDFELYEKAGVSLYSYTANKSHTETKTSNMFFKMPCKYSFHLSNVKKKKKKLNPMSLNMFLTLHK